MQETKDNYARIVQENLDKLYDNLPEDLAKNLPGEQEGKRFVFDAFGEKCFIEPGWPNSPSYGDQVVDGTVTWVYRDELWADKMRYIGRET